MPGRALLLLLTALACGAETPAARHLVVVVIDATNAAHLGCYGGPPEASPHIDALAARGVRFEHAYSNTTWTLPSTASLMTGRLPESHGVVTIRHRPPEGIPLVSELLGRAGWSTTALVQMPFASGAYGLDRGFDFARYYRAADEEDTKVLKGAVAQWTNRLDADPSFLYLHLRRPHSPYDPDPLMRAPFERGCALASEVPELHHLAHGGAVDEPLREHIVHLYRANLRQADAWVGEIADALADRLATDTYLVITSDHGEGLGERGFYGHARKIYDENVRIPLVVLGPDVAPGVVETPVSTVDLLPTLLDLAGVPAPPGIDGRTLAPWLSDPDLELARRPVITVSRWYDDQPPSVAVTEGRFKLLLDRDGTVNVYDLHADPGETEDVSSEHPEVAARLLRLAEPRQAWTPGEAATEGPLDAELQRDLEALGYLK